ncbi:Bug family tripartite tricarboxylate transporter substrate binding protein [Teichococcus vastitatis]|uniref:Tripartite tricarboxylate transporter substrate binding protein n=1 Tax=Teichococcus vastitatis TaxID=2307076 RepID=A0ABS9W895_9PROT|nr:tripartite tricarboxylate transporter substrate binding protein [Pseudoroseomonas vastitatis]MCI0755140.1 tripartite tricarboxylate transporter substrate binding protein [Pseudoroseomonas vastitatis]
MTRYLTTGLALGRRTLLAAPAIFGSTAALAQPGNGDWPRRTVRVVVPWPPGGGADTVGRILFTHLSETMRASFVIENRPGAAGAIGAAAAARSEPDGYTVLYDATPQTINPALHSDMPFDLWRDLRPVFLAAVVPNLLIATPSAPARSVADLIAAAKEAPGSVNIGSSGNGSAQHMALELFRQAAGITVNHVPYRGGGPLTNDVIGGQIPYGFANGSAATGHVSAGSVRALCHTGTGRLASLPDVPSMEEALPGAEAYEWNGVFVPAGTPDAVIERLNTALNAAIRDPTIAGRLAQLNVGTRANTPADFGIFLRAEWDKWHRVVRQGNIRID